MEAPVEAIALSLVLGIREEPEAITPQFVCQRSTRQRKWKGMCTVPEPRKNRRSERLIGENIAAQVGTGSK
jgi:hypothetical protein